MMNALLSALLKTLPADDHDFPVKDRRRFLRALAVNLDVVYGEPADGAVDADKVAALFKATA